MFDKKIKINTLMWFWERDTFKYWYFYSICFNSV